MILSFLYLIFIYPIEMFIETVFSVSMKLFSNPGISIIGVSLFVQTLVLPLYKRADAIQEEERQKQEQMRPWVEHIKGTFKKDERFMILSEYYRQQGYEPIMSLRGTLSLLLQVPFFIAAYHYLSNLEMLRGTAFSVIRDLGSPDGLIAFGGFNINALPILMTLINVISGAIYTKGHGVKEKVQLYVTAAVFLVLLYDSPAGLVFYWTLNNLFSLLKNIVMKILHQDGEKEKAGIAIEPGDMRIFNRMFFLSSAALAVFAGFWIPAYTVADSPLEFVVRGHYSDPVLYVFESLAIGTGIFVLWFGIFYMMASSRGKKMLARGNTALVVCALVQAFLFSKDMGNMSNIMVYDFEPVYHLCWTLINLAVIAGVFSAVYLFSGRFRPAASIMACLVFLTLLVISVSDVILIEKNLADNSYVKDDEANTDVFPKYTLSRNGRNVVVLMLDRGISGYVPYIMDEFPDLKEKFRGFTYYPNAYSYGAVTLTGGPALFGGYDYLPLEIGSDTDDLDRKLDSSIRFLPYNFSKAHFRSTVFDPPDYINLAGSDLDSFFDGIPDTSVFDVGGNVRSRDDILEDYGYLKKWALHNYIRHSLYIMAPLAFRSFLYDGGNYLSQDTIRENMTLIGERRELELLPEMAEISEGDDDNLFVVTNLTAHSYARLQLPDFAVADKVDNSGYLEDWNSSLHGDGAMALDDMTDTDRFRSYCANAAAFLELGKWMDFLRQEGVYDNTRIIIVADHGFYAYAFPQMVYEGETSFEQFNPVMMVKDFGSREYTVSDELVSNADTCAFAMKDIIDDPTDPYDGRPAIISMEKTGDIILTDYPDYDLDKMKKREYVFRTDVRDPDNWQVLFDE